MGIVEIIENVFGAGVLLEQLLRIPDQGASEVEIVMEEEAAGRLLSEQHKTLMRRWNGIDLDVIRFYSCGAGGVGCISSAQRAFCARPAGALVIASDPAGFLYYDDMSGSIWSFDPDGAATKRLAADLEEFLGRLVFGPDAASFGGEEWADELRHGGLI